MPLRLLKKDYALPIFWALGNLALFIVKTGHGLRKFCESYEAFKMYKTPYGAVEIHIDDNARKLLTNSNGVFVSVHHRNWSEQKHLEYFAQFAFLRYFQDVHVLIHHKTSSWISNMIMTKFYSAHNLAMYNSSEERYFSIVDLMSKGLENNRKTAVIVYPDKHGSIFQGDRSMCFRDGLFAASMYMRLPIIDIIALEPTASRPWHYIHISHYATNFDMFSTDKSTQADYTTWRSKNIKLIHEKTLEAEERYKNILDSIEQPGCWSTDDVSTCSLEFEKDSISMVQHAEACQRLRDKKKN